MRRLAPLAPSSLARPLRRRSLPAAARPAIRRPAARRRSPTSAKGTEAEALAVGPKATSGSPGSTTARRRRNVVGRISPGGAVDEYTVPAHRLGARGRRPGPRPGRRHVVHRARREPDRTGRPDRSSRRLRGADPGQPADRDRRRPGRLPLGDAGRDRQGRPARCRSAHATEIGARRRSPAGGDRARPRFGALGGRDGNRDAGRESGCTGSASASFPLPTDGAIFTRDAQLRHRHRPRRQPLAEPGRRAVRRQGDPDRTQPEYVRFEVPERELGTTLISQRAARRHLVRRPKAARSARSPRTGTKSANSACALKGCAGPIKALAEGPEGDLWFALRRIGRPLPPAAARSLPKRGRCKRRGELTMAVECRGGAAGQRCGGKLELLPRQGLARSSAASRSRR